MFLHYDTETTGLPLEGEPSDHPGHPKMLSITGILEDLNGNILRSMSCLVKHDGYTIDERMTDEKGNKTAFAVNGISNDMVQKYGLPLDEVMKAFHAMTLPKTVIVAFNYTFDWKMLKISAATIGGDAGEALRKYYEEHVRSICTMRAAAHHLYGKQRVSLVNAHKELFKRSFEGAHGSFADAFASRAVFHELRRRGVVFEPRSLVYSAPTPSPQSA